MKAVTLDGYSYRPDSQPVDKNIPEADALPEALRQNETAQVYYKLPMYKALDKWLPAYIRQRLRPYRFSEGIVDVCFCICDHFEPFHDARRDEALARVDRWLEEYPRLVGEFRDADGRPPQHTFFYPIEQMDEEILEKLTKLTSAGYGEVEIHLHHDEDTAEALTTKLEEGKAELAHHGFLSHDPNGNLRYGFIHGDWALDNSHPSGRHCGVRNELSVLCDTGCYADFTMPSVPSSTQTRTINSLYYATPSMKPKSHDTGEHMQVWENAPARPAWTQGKRQRLVLVQGPLGLDWRRRKLGLLPRIERGDLTGINPPTANRLRIWLDAGIHVHGQPQWLFVKLYTHGGLPQNMTTLLGQTMSDFHRHLTTEYNDGTQFRLHYVTARELVNIAHAAELKRTGNPNPFRDFFYSRERRADPAGHQRHAFD